MKKRDLTPDYDKPCSSCGAMSHDLLSRCSLVNNAHADDELGVGEGAPLYNFQNWKKEDREAVKEWLRERERKDAELKKGRL